VISVFTNFNKF